MGRKATGPSSTSSEGLYLFRQHSSGGFENIHQVDVVWVAGDLIAYRSSTKMSMTAPLALVRQVTLATLPRASVIEPRTVKPLLFSLTE